MHRFFYPANKIDPLITINDAHELHHLKNVLRLKAGSPIQVFNGKGDVGEGRIKAINTDAATIEMTSVTKHKKPKLYLALAVAIPKKSKFETIIEKATELGVSEIIPLETKRTEVKFKGERLEKKMRRFETVALNAAKQCKRTELPVIRPVSPFKKALDKAAAESTVIMPGLIKPRQNLFDTLAKASEKITVFIGPEGDFTDNEYAYAKKRGAVIVSLGEHTLKVETAALCTIAGIQLFFQL